MAVDGDLALPMASSSPDWVLGVARFSSSTSTTLANTGPGRNWNDAVSGCQMLAPTMSAGNRSTVACTRAKLPPRLWARLRASWVLPTPGWSSTSRCPPASSTARTTSNTGSESRTLARTLARSRSPSSANSFTVSSGASTPATGRR